MKTKQLLLTFLLLIATLTTYAQTSIEQAGIAIQGIARGTDNTAKANTTVNLTFNIYYKVNDSPQPPIYSNTVPVDTDDFGVFSHVISNNFADNHKFANYPMWLQILEGSTEISNEQLRHVPYAISANNGVPTGSIMPFVGASADVPAGWALCNGLPLPADATKLIAMIGNNTPNLGGMFLRGAGNNTNPGYENNDGPALNVKQQDGFAQHMHGIDFTSRSRTLGNLPISSTPWYGASFVTTGSGGFGSWNVVINGGGGTNYSRGNTTGTHTHEIQGSTEDTGIVETRPVNYGVNYIIKL